MPYRLSKRAAEDLRNIHRFGTRQFGRGQADAYHRSLEHLFELLADNPKIARERREISPPVRVHRFEAHMVIYMEREDGSVLIVRVRHHRENWTSPMLSLGG